MACTLVYKKCIQTYDQISIQRNWSKVKLHRAILLWLGLKGVKIARNIAKVGVHSYLSNEYSNLWSNFNFKNLIKSETPSWGFAKVWLKEGKIDLNIMKFGMHSYLPNGHLNLGSNFNSKKLVKRETPLCGFAKLGPKGGENTSERRKICVYAYLLIANLNLLLHLISKKMEKIATF